MTDTMIVSVIAPTITTILAGIGYLFKKKIDSIERKRDEETKERNERRDKIEERQDRMEEDLTAMQGMLASCDNPDCKVRPLFAKYLLDRANKKRLDNNLN